MNTHGSRWWLLALLLVAALPRPASGQLLDDENRYTFQLRDGTQVVVLGTASPLGSRTPSLQYFYLPTNLRLARQPDGTPEFLFLKYTSDSGMQGGLLHFLMEWGLTAAQQQELKGLLTAARPNAQLAGAAQVAAGENGSFRIISATLSGGNRQATDVLVSSAPITPGGRAVGATDLDAQRASLLEATFTRARSIADLSVELRLSYRTLVPAAQGRITMDWSQLEQHYDSLTAEYKRTRNSTAHTEDCFWFVCVSSSRPQYSYSYEEMRRQYDYMLSKRVIALDFDERVADERVTKIREAFFQYFLESFAQKGEPEETPPAPSDTASTPDIRSGDHYKYKRVIQRDVQRIRVDTFALNFRLAFNTPIALTGNLASWYDAVKDNPRAVASVNLSQPFYERYNVMFRVDFDAPKELFSSAINYVTITMRKQRPEGAPFERAVTIDENYVRDRGVVASMSYARGTDANPSEFEYKVQWSLKGGLLYPTNPTWQRSNSLQAITLVPPVVPRRIEVEGDLDALKANNITRVTAQIHHMQFGREVEENIQLPVSGGEPLVNKTIFTDRDARGYAYRLIVNHQREGRLALPWSPKVGDDYIYAGVPQDLLSVSGMLEAARDSARSIAGSATNRVLDVFANVLGGGNPR